MTGLAPFLHKEMRETLREMSLRATGEPRLLTVTAQVPLDGALAWPVAEWCSRKRPPPSTPGQRSNRASNQIARASSRTGSGAGCSTVA